MIRAMRYLPILLGISVTAAIAQDADPPAHVGRLNLLNGTVSFRPGSVEEWVPATLNYPLTTGDHLWTDAGSQAEIHVGATAIRMAPQTALAVLNLDDRTVQLSVTQGSVNVRLRSLGEDETFEVDTPNVAGTLLRPGDYRIDADGDNNLTTFTVRSGDAELTANGAAFPVHARESARLSGVDNVSQEINAAPPVNDFDEWCQVRDRREDEAQVSARYVPRDMIGYEDLDEYGTWRQVPDYGWVWAPRAVAVGWAPYHYGHWAWVEPWGWTWIDDAPWGFAPFHYGRWAFVGGGWVWLPGRMVVGARPVYAPALVAFVGGGGFGVAVGAGGGVAAWFPLGPGEVYRPAYHVSEVYVRQVNIVHVTNVNVINVTNVRYVNQGVQGAVTVVPREAFVGARPVNQFAVRVDARQVATAQVVGSTAPVAPQRVSVLGHAGAAAPPPPARFAERAVVARTTPPPPPVSFAAKQQALQANQGRPLEPAQVNTLRSTAPPPRPMVRTVNSMPARPPQPVVSTGQPRTEQQPQDRRVFQQRNDRPQQQNTATPQTYQRPPQTPQTPPAQPATQRPVEPTRQTPATNAQPASEERRQVNQSPRSEKQPRKKDDKKEEKKDHYR